MFFLLFFLKRSYCFCKKGGPQRKTTRFELLKNETQKVLLINMSFMTVNLNFF